MALTGLDVGRDEVFRKLGDLDCHYSLLHRPSSAYESWRGQLTLAEKYWARQKGWPVRTTLRPGFFLGPEVGLERWEAEQAFNGLLEGAPEYLRYAEYLLENSVGFWLDLPGAVNAIFVSDRYFDGVVEIGDPTHVAGPPVLV